MAKRDLDPIDSDSDPLRLPSRGGCAVLLLGGLVVLFLAFFIGDALSDTGLTFTPGSPTSWRPSGQGSFHPECSPFDAAGELAVSRFGPEWACRYTGGNVEATTATPRCGAEWEPHASGALRAWCEAGRPRDGSLPGGALILPGASSDCSPTSRELVDLIYSPDCFAFVAEWVWARAGDPAGKSAEKPMDTCRHDLPWVFFAEPHVQYPGTWVFFKNTCRPAGEISYAPARRQKDAQGREVGARIPPYPRVFGPPTAGGAPSGPVCGDGRCDTGEACAADCRPPVNPPTPQEPRPISEADCAAFLEPLRAQLAGANDETARLRSLPPDLVDRLHGVGTWQSVGSAERGALADLSRWLLWTGLDAPQDVRATIAEAPTWQRIAGGRRSRLYRLGDWLRSLLYAPSTPSTGQTGLVLLERP